MSIYPDKKNGKLTGRFRVEVQGRYARYRARCDSIGEARAKDNEFKALAAEGVPPPPRSTKVGGRPPANHLHLPPGSPQALVDAVAALIGAQPQTEPSVLFSKALDDARGRVWSNPRTNASNENCLRIMHELMGDVELNGIDTPWVMDLKEKLKDNRKGKKGSPIKDATINRFLAALSTFLQYATDRGWRTVTSLPKMEYGDEDEGRIRWFSPDEETELNRLLPENCRKLMGIAIRTGARRAELLNLTVEQVQNGRIILWGTGTKSGKSRAVPLAPGDEETLRWLLDGHMPTDGELRGEWEKARKVMGMEQDEDFVFHACRHTYATRAILKRVPIRVLQQLLGHATIKMTERYSHVCDAMTDDAVALMFGVADESIAA